jgi:hypothetical protein
MVYTYFIGARLTHAFNVKYAWMKLLFSSKIPHNNLHEVVRRILAKYSPKYTFKDPQNVHGRAGPAADKVVVQEWVQDEAGNVEILIALCPALFNTFDNGVHRVCVIMFSLFFW